MAGFFQLLFGRLGGTAAAAESPPATPVTPPPITAGDERLPDASRPRVAKLLAVIADVEARADEDAGSVTFLAELRQMRDAHLPRLIASYADIPAAHRADIFRATGRSASFELNAALDKMLERAEGLSRSLAQQDIDSFAHNLRFIERRYGDDPFS
ncbi:MAG TPA: hypothetical protein VF628_04400 [Allosphingosinicella sp.]|jgi:hypothetical protein